MLRILALAPSGGLLEEQQHFLLHAECFHLSLYGNFLLLRPYHNEHGPKVPVTPEYIVFQRVLRKRGCMSILAKNSNKHASYSNGG
jgi:hypothetical protein